MNLGIESEKLEFKKSTSELNSPEMLKALINIILWQNY